MCMLIMLILRLLFFGEHEITEKHKYDLHNRHHRNIFFRFSVCAFNYYVFFSLKRDTILFIRCANEFDAFIFTH